MDVGCYTLISPQSTDIDAASFSEQQLSQDLQAEDPRRKSDGLKRLIRLILNGEKLPNLLMIVIRYVMPCQDNGVKKLLLLFWEIVPKYSADGKLRQEMILVCDAYRRDLQHPNEYIRGATLRFLCKLKEPELLEPLMPAIRQCLECRHAYVRRNAVLALATIYRIHDFLVPDAPQRIENFLEQEQDASCKRNAFMALLNCDQERALRYLTTCLDQVNTFNDILQLVIVELIYRVCHSQPAERSRFIRCVYGLLQSNSAAVRYEAASTLLSLSAAPTAIRAVASAYIEIILKESDNNVKLIVLDRLIVLCENHEKILQDQLMDILRILSATDLEVRQKTLRLSLNLVTSRTIEEMIGSLRKELIKAFAQLSQSANRGSGVQTGNTTASNTASSNKTSQIVAVQQNEERSYRYELVHTIYLACMRFPDVITSVVPSMCEILTYEEVSGSSGGSPGTVQPGGGVVPLSQHASEEACRFLRESVLRFPQLKSLVLDMIVEYFPGCQATDVQRHLLWILGEFSSTGPEIRTFVGMVRAVLGSNSGSLVDDEVSRLSSENSGTANELSASEAGDVSGKSAAAKRATSATAPLVTADGTYATQSALTSAGSTTGNKGKSGGAVDRAPLQASLFLPDFLPGVLLSVAMVKVWCRMSRFLREQEKLEEGELRRQENKFAAECQLVIASLIHLGRSRLLPHSINPDHFDRMWFCVKALSDRRPLVLRVFDEICLQKLADLIAAQEKTRKKMTAAGFSDEYIKNEGRKKRVHVDQPIRFLQLSTARCGSGGELDVLEDRFNLTMSQALGTAGVDSQSGNVHSTGSGGAATVSLLSRVRQLTGFSDPIYAEAYVNVNQYDIMLDVLVVNQTTDTLQNLTLELTTLGDLKLVEKPQALNLAPHDFANIKANIKVSSSENGVIFGNIVYDVRGSTGDGTCVVLNDIHIDILEYILPASCSSADYQRMWTEFEWENKVTVNTKITDLHLFLAHMLQHTNLRCLTPPEALEGDCDYLCVKLYSRSIFGEHILTNLCLERPPGANQPVVGHIRIRAKTQGMAVTMGEKMSQAQKLQPSAELEAELAARLSSSCSSSDLPPHHQQQQPISTGRKSSESGDQQQPERELLGRRFSSEQCDDDVYGGGAGLNSASGLAIMQTA